MHRSCSLSLCALDIGDFLEQFSLPSFPEACIDVKVVIGAKGFVNLLKCLALFSDVSSRENKQTCITFEVRHFRRHVAFERPFQKTNIARVASSAEQNCATRYLPFLFVFFSYQSRVQLLHLPCYECLKFSSNIA